MKKIIWTYPSYFFLLPFFFVLHHNNVLLGFIPFTESAVAFFLCMSYLLAWFALFYFLSHSVLRSALNAFLIGLVTLYFGVYHDFLKALFPRFWITSYKVIVPVTILIIILVSKVVSSSGIRLKKTLVYLNLLFILLIGLEVTQLAINAIRIQSHHNLIYSLNPISKDYKLTAKTDKPDIYFLVFDAYTNSQTLRKIWNFDNSPFTEWLMKRGFYVIDSSRANYDFTAYSITSTFNMNYLNSESATKGNIPLLMLRAQKSLSYNETINILSREGYTIRFFAPFENKWDDIGLYHQFNAFPFKELYNETFPMRFRRDILWNFLNLENATYEDFRKRAEDAKITMDELKKSTDSSGNRPPRFIYGHFMITHQPHLFDSVGNLRKGRELLAQHDLAATYVQQIQYANIVIQDLVKYIQDHNKKNTIIILEGDHGFRNFPSRLDPNQFPNLNAIYFPDKNYKDLYSDMSPVNTFRIIFNNYFGQHLPLLKDSSVFVEY